MIFVVLVLHAVQSESTVTTWNSSMRLIIQRGEPTYWVAAFMLVEQYHATLKQAIFRKVDATETGSLSGKQVIGLFAKSGLDKTALAVIWR